MANYVASARSNYFKVKDAAAFSTWVAGLPDVGVWAGPNPDTFAIFSNNADGAGWPLMVNRDGEDEPLDLPGELSEHLTDDSIAVLMEIGAEKLRYLVGYATAINSKGEVEQISLEDIYDLANERLGIRPGIVEF